MIRPGFLDSLALEEAGVNADGEPVWRLTRELRYDSAVLGARVVVPAGFETDLSSVPRWPYVYWRLGGRGRRAGVIHDWLYQTHVSDRARSDRVYPEALSVSEDVPVHLRWLAYLMLRLAGWRRW